jgi:hypothetical protein
MTSSFFTTRRLVSLVLALAVGAGAASAQVTTGTVSGRIVDPDDGAVPGVVVHARNVETGFAREATTDGEGVYRLAALPNGRYEVTTSISGFRDTRAAVTVNVSVNVPLDVKLEIAQRVETVEVSAEAPRASSLVRVVDLPRVQGVPLNGQQIADVVALLPGVGPGFNADPTKSSQRTAQISGGNGRNTNTTVDGGDNNDDTTGGMLQAIPLEAIEEFTLVSHRPDAQHARGAATLNLVTKSGTNTPRGSWFTFLRDDALNARTYTEKKNDVEKGAYERYQYGGSFGGPVVRNRAHFFAAYERTQQETLQAVNTGGVLPGDGVYPVPYRANLFTGKVTVSPTTRQYLAIRYARDHNTQPSGVAPNAARSTWVTSTNEYDSINLNHNWQTGRTAVNEFLFQYSRYRNDIPGNTTAPQPAFTLLNGAVGGANNSAPQTTEQQRWQLRNDFSWTAGGGHEVRTGVNLILTPTLRITNESGLGGIFSLLGNSRTSPVGFAMLIGGHVESNIPLHQYGFYVQDDWRVSDRLTVNLGVRWDYLDGMPIGQSSADFLKMQTAGQAGAFAGTHLEDFGKSTRGDFDNIQPRVGVVFDPAANGRNIIRGGWGIYTDVAYTNANALVASLTGGGIVLQASNPNGLLKTDGTFFTIDDPIESLGIPLSTASTNEVVSPRLEQPYTVQTNVGWSHELNRTTSLSFDYVRVAGEDLHMRLRTNPRVNGVRYLAPYGITSSGFRTAISEGRSRYNALIVSGRKRMSRGFDVDASYTLADAKTDVGTAYDELTQSLLQDVTNPFSDFQLGPATRTDARHRVTASALVDVPLGIRVAGVLSLRSALPITTLVGSDLNGDGQNNDHTPIAYRYTGLNDNGTATFEEAGPCETVNCSRRAPFSQVNLRISRSFRLMGPARIEAIADIFNVFNAINPALPLSSAANGIDSSTGQPVANPFFMQPTAYAGDAGQGEQRLAQFGIRLTF